MTASCCSQCHRQPSVSLRNRAASGLYVHLFVCWRSGSSTEPALDHLIKLYALLWVDSGSHEVDWPSAQACSGSGATASSTPISEYPDDAEPHIQYYLLIDPFHCIVMSIRRGPVHHISITPHTHHHDHGCSRLAISINLKASAAKCCG